MAASASAGTPFDIATGCAGPLSVSLRRKGEALELFSLDRPTGPVASAVDDEASVFIYWAPRPGVERYPDWSAFELSCRAEGQHHTRTWRLAEDSQRVCFLGQLLSTPGPRLPLAAALWRAWARPWSGARGLLWQGPESTHLWLWAPETFPRHARLTGGADCETVLVELQSLGTRRDFTLDVGGLHADFRQELAGRLAGTVLPAEPFARFLVSERLRAALAGPVDPAAYMPAVGAALALLEGPPAPLPCASYPAAGAGAC